MPPPQLVVVGAGHIAVPLAAMGKMLDYEVVVIDDRVTFANKTRFPTAEHRALIAEEFDAADF